MNGSVVAYADKIISICEEMKALPFSGSAFDALLGRLQRLAIGFGEIMDAPDAVENYRMRREARLNSRFDATIDFSEFAGGKWVTTENGNKVYIDKDGKPVAGNPYVLEAITKVAGEKAARQEAIKKYPRAKDMECEEKVSFEKSGTIGKDSKGRDVTYFNHDEDSMQIDVPVYISTADKNFKICRGTIEHLTIFASSKVGRGLDVAEKLSEQVGGSSDSWKHCKGIGTVEGEDGVRRKADLHWFESPEAGQVLWKIKNYMDDMGENDRYWVEEKKNG